MQYQNLLTGRGRMLGAWCVLVCFVAVAWAQTGRQLGLPDANGNPQKRVALVIGNGAYQNVRKLKNPTNDALDVAATLRDVGFELVGGAGLTNLTQAQMKGRIREFGEMLASGNNVVGVFYYAGHGVQFDGKNYLLPVELSARRLADIEDGAVELQYVLNNMRDARNGLNIVILDACRNNPLEGTVRDAKDGLAEVQAAAGTLIAYATVPGRTAADGTGQNGTYTEELLRQIKKPGVSVTELLQEVSSQVYQKTRGTKLEQAPWQSLSPLTGRFCFGGCVGPRPTPRDEGPDPIIARRDAKELERDAWLLVRNSNDAQDFRDFLRLYPNGANAGSAKIRLEQLAWEAARNNGSKAALEAYLKEFPTGDNAPTATLMLNRILRANQPAPVVPSGGNSPPNSAAQVTAGTVRRQDIGRGVEMSFAWIPAGEFAMGATNGDGDEKPVHRVTLSQGYWMGTTEVTQLQWRTVMGSDPPELYFKGCDQCPVERVSWDDVQEYVKNMNARGDGFTYRLPTGAEWEYAARAGTMGDYAGPLEEMAWYDANSGDKTHPVGTKKANAWGLYDMHGNVWEWVQDWFGGYGSVAVTDPRGPATGSGRVVRGGGSGYPAQGVRAAKRRGASPGLRADSLGFRLVRVAV